MKEIWKSIEYFPNYQISNYGNVKNKEKILKPLLCSSGYLFVRLYNKTEVKNLKIHRLVATAFIKNPQNKSCVNHIDGNKKNNNVKNLEWCTYKENSLHAYKIGLNKVTDKMREACKINGKKTGKINGQKVGKENIKKAIQKNKIKVKQYSKEGKYINTYDSITDAGKFNKIKKCNISANIKGRTKTAGGYIWKYAD